MNILLVDDDADDVELFQEAVLRIDPTINVVVASTALDALELLANEGKKGANFPDFIFIDINMPVMNGIEFLEILKEDVRVQGTCITMYTTSSNVKEIERCKRLGADFITKPFEFEVLVEKLAKAFRRAGTC